MDTEATEHPAAVASTLHAERPGSAASQRRRVCIALAAVGVGVAFAAAVYCHLTTPKVRYATAEVTTGTLTIAVTATGTLKPRHQIEIGSEISGVVERVHVDVNDHVGKGQLLATLDKARLKSQLLQAEGAKVAAEALLIKSVASLKEAKTYQARLLRLRTLSSNRLPSELDEDLAAANVVRAEAKIAEARAALAQAYATRETVRTDISKAEIRSPIDGVVLARAIEPGQTVTASLQSPIMFVVAEDLRRMDLHAALNEADIGSVQVGQQAWFVVEAYPDRTYSGRVSRIHLASSNTRGATPNGVALPPPNVPNPVVTYETVVEVDNADLTLRPGMSATAEITTGRLTGATLVPNAAFGFTPAHAQVPRAEDDNERGRGMMALMPYVADRWKCPREAGRSLGCVWVLDDGEPQLAVFTPGPADGPMTQVLPLDELPRWASLARLRNDPVLLRAIKRKLTPGTHVIVGDGSASMN